MELTQANPRPAPGPIDKGLWFALGVIATILMSLGLLDIVGAEFATPVITSIKGFINWMMGPKVYSIVSILLFAAMLKYRQWVETRWIWMLTFLSAAFFIFSWDDANFRLIMTKGDNIPIAIMLILVGYFTWLSLSQAFANDRRIKAGLPPLEQDDTNKRVWTWPDLVYSEFLSMIIFSVILVAWSLAVAAPLEQPSNPANTPNPSKAPWYFLGLQEMLVYFDPWMAGVVLPGLIIVGLMAIPYVDTNPKGNGYYVFDERRWEIGIYLFGFIVMWVLLIILGTFLRGPNWNFFGPYEYWDVHKILALNNVDLAEMFWLNLPGGRLPQHWLIREMPGILLTIGYMCILPVVLAKTWFKRFYEKMGAPRYYATVVFLFLPMMALPIKMVLRWTFNLKYVVHIGEYFFNI